MDRKVSDTLQDPNQGHETNGTSNGTRDHEEANGRRADLRSELEVMEHYQSFVTSLLSVVSTAPMEDVGRLVQVIRSGASQQQILDVIAELLPDDSSSELSSRTRSQ
ncbi:hypothetical protein BJX70DRAFT_403580 [Aspergillus crustosus]